MFKVETGLAYESYLSRRTTSPREDIEVNSRRLTNSKYRFPYPHDMMKKEFFAAQPIELTRHTTLSTLSFA